MSDAERRRWQLGEIGLARSVGTREAIREAFHGTHQGEALPSSPTGRTPRSGVEAVSLPQQPYGVAISVTTGVQIFDGAGTACEWVGTVPGPRTAGFRGLVFPTDRLPFPLLATYRLDVNGGWESYLGGITVTVLRNGVQLWRHRLPFITEYDRSFNLGPCEPDLDNVQVLVSPVGWDGAEPDGQAGTFTASLVLVERPVGVSAPPPLGCYQVAWGSSGHSTFRVRRWHQEGDEILDSIGASIVTDTWYGIRARIDGARIRARHWPWGDSEPSSWQLDVVDPNPLGAGVVGLSGAQSTTGARRYDLLEATGAGGGAASTDFSEYPTGQTPDGWGALSEGPQSADAWEVVADSGAVGGQLLQQTGAGGFFGWMDGGSWQDVEVLAKVARTSSNDHVGVILRGNPIGM